ncbi:glycosyltransferase [Subtercola boreus]|uniref:Glycosyl transferase family 1 n=1 Tax=Subtercola boreus TaxID=120213 RepID=A0A3E0WAX9_9MICO|nr:glycosyltransferase [Subtercola boreus]RFA21195.1 glycosyl transferase family 1 [Subtercola boreus]RFA21578.1 glycosyl transferase family 1 [Subtercola boreus]RFA27547.1 glycosyl transferase family 1 [Subtercola boreus]
MTGFAGIDGSLAGRTVLFAQPTAELYGSDRVLLESVEAVLADGGRAVVALPLGGPLVAVLEAAGAEVELCETPVLSKSSLRPKGFVSFLAATVRGHRSGNVLLARVRPDVMYVNTVTVPLWIALARLARVPVLAHIHEAEGSIARPIAAALNLPLRFASRVIANSAYSVQVLAKSYPCLAGRTLVVYNGVPGPQTSEPARQTLEGGLRILFVGRLSTRKGAEVAVDALGLLTDRGVAASLDLVGAPVPGQERYEADLICRVAALGLTDRVRMHGFQNDVWPHLQRADVAVVPSLYDEPFGNTAVEALLAARPVVVSDTSGLREAAGGYLSSRAVAPGDASALAASLFDLQEHWATVRIDAAVDAISANEKHSPERYRQTISRLVLELITGESAPGFRTNALTTARLTTNEV